MKDRNGIARVPSCELAALQNGSTFLQFTRTFGSHSYELGFIHGFLGNEMSVSMLVAHSSNNNNNNDSNKNNNSHINNNRNNHTNKIHIGS